MGYYITSYLTDSSEIKKIYGSKNEKLLATLIKELSEELNSLNEDFDYELTANKNSKEILTDIINGEVRFPEIAFMYGYIYEQLCKYYGKIIAPPGDEYSTPYYWEIPKSSYKAFISIPFSDDFPEIYSIEVNNLETERDLFLSLKERKGISEEDLNIEKEDFKFIFAEAIKQKKDLVFFLY
ncbi:hypothetical protein NYQ10_10520 [Flavobacterium johnsoniae]|uniref:DUF7691 family protein n=1 Tax=Flavobacterium johnsoniae TaxID=986 RepID=UPI0025AED76A|nr:hypothetical protein [Flavobacterium johnsoniae]WJS96867.1 hypothetical protein NYQ10_10520 [Flavobacterium johnsoniae]